MTYAPATREQCTLSGDDIQLNGAIDNMNPFGASFADGEQVSYRLFSKNNNKSGMGVGVFNTGSPNTIARTDTWTCSGEVVDKKPLSNIAMTGDGYVVDCVVPLSGLKAPSLVRSFAGGSDRCIQPMGLDGGGAASPYTLTAARAYHAPTLIPARTSINQLSFSVTTAVAASLTRVGVATMDELTGEAHQVILESPNIDTSTTGIKKYTLGTSKFFERETMVYFWLISDSAIAVSGFSRNDMNYIEGFPTSQWGDGKAYNLVWLPVASGAPAYPTLPVAMDTGGINSMPWIFAEYD